MTPTVRDILIDARKRVHAAIADSSNIGDTNALLNIDSMLTADALRANTPGMHQSNLTCHLAEQDSRPTEKIEREPDLATQLRALKTELEREKRLREADGEIIRGLQKKLRGE